MRREINVLLFILVFVSASTLAYDWSTNPGDGTPEHPYEISTPEHLMSIGSYPDLLDKHYILTNDIIFDPNNNPEHISTHALIAPNLSDSSEYQGTPFSGSFDGNQHTIHRLTITGGNHYLGLFGKIQADSLESIIIRNVFLTDSYVSARYYVGSLAGCLDGGIVKNCFVYNGEVTARYCGGGLIGFNESGHLTNACFVGSVDLPDLISGHDIGGLVGRNGGMINYCFAIADLNVLFDAGGLVGYNEGVISNCYSGGILSGASYIGGLVGADSSEEHLIPAITNCYTATLVQNNDGPDYWTGGFIGVKTLSTYRDCYWDITINPELTGIGGNLNDPNIVGLPTQQMKQQGSFVGWDFVGEEVNGTDDIWRMCVDGINYPKLWWQYSTLGDFVCPDGVGIEDLMMLTDYWLETGLEPLAAPDATGDGQINLDDFAITSQNWMEGN